METSFKGIVGRFVDMEQRISEKDMQYMHRMDRIEARILSIENAHRIEKAHQCDTCRHSDNYDGDCEDECVFERVEDDKVIIYKHEYDDDECDVYIGERHTHTCVPWYSHIENARKFSVMADAVEYARELGIVNDVSFKFVSRSRMSR